MKYRPEVDGLRAIAVVSVILYHAEMVLGGGDPFQGGYLGVDVFFVISGYLITKIILSELADTGAFSFAHFYERRARRILPMLLTIMVVSIPFSLLILMPDALENCAESIIYAIFFASNYFFYSAGTEYGADSSLLMPFLHTWSLAVEEQFYIVLPPLLILIHKFARRHLSLIFGVLFILSLAFSQYMVDRNTELNFYLTFSRFWELLSGSILAHVELRRGRATLQRGRELVPLIGLALMLAAIAFFDHDTPHPGLLTIIPVGGVTLLIAYSSEHDRVGRILGSKPFVGIGLISYSLYLWHFPIFAYARWARITDSRVGAADITNLEKLGLIAITFALAIVSYYLIETPTRKRMPIRRLVAGLAGVTVFMLVFGYGAKSTAGFPGRIPTFLEQARFDDREAYHELFQECHRRKTLDFCTLGDHEKRAYLVGDSHMIAIAFDLQERLDTMGYSLTIMTRSAALYGRDAKIDDARDTVFDTVRDSVVVLGGYAHQHDAAFFEASRPRYEALLETLRANGNTVILVYPVPSVNLQYSMLLVNEYNFTGRLKDRSVPFGDFQKESAAAYAFYDSLQGDHIRRVYPADHSCIQGDCYAVKDNTIYISDYDHPSSHFTALINTDIVAQIPEVN